MYESFEIKLIKFEYVESQTRNHKLYIYKFEAYSSKLCFKTLTFTIKVAWNPHLQNPQAAIFDHEFADLRDRWLIYPMTTRARAGNCAIVEVRQNGGFGSPWTSCVNVLNS